MTLPIDVDPALGRGGSLLSTLAAATACAVLGYLFGRGLAGVMGVFRDMAADSSDCYWFDSVPHLSPISSGPREQTRAVLVLPCRWFSGRC